MTDRAPLLPKASWRKRCAVGLLIFIAILCLTALAIRWLATTSLGHNYAERRIEALNISGQSISVDGIHGDLLGDLAIDAIKVSDANGDWVNARDVKASWTPGSLLRRRLNIQLLSASEIDISRQPILTHSDAPSGRSSYLDRYTLDKLDIDLINLSEEMIPGTAQYQLDADIDTVVSAGRIGLELRPKDPFGDKIEGHLDWGNAQPLSGELSASGPSDGLLYKLLYLSTNSDVEIKVTGRGAPDDWQVDASGVSGDKSIFSLDAFGNGIHGLAKGQIDLSLIEPLTGTANRLGSVIDFETRITEQPAAQTRLSASLKSKNLSIEASMPFDASRRIANVSEISIEAVSKAPDDILQIDALTVSNLASQGIITRDAEDWHYTGNVSAGDVTAAGFQAKAAEGPLSIFYKSETGRISVDTSIGTRSFTSPAEALNPIIGSSPTLTSSLIVDTQQKRLSVSSATIETENGRATTSGHVAFDARDVSLTGQADLRDDSGRAVLSNGLWTFDRKNNEDFTFNGHGKLSAPAGIPELETFLITPADFSFKGQIKPNGVINLSSARLIGENASLSSQGRYNNGKINAVIEADFEKLDIGNVSARALRIETTAKGALDDLSINLHAQPDMIAVSGTELGIESAKFVGKYQGAAFSGTANLNGIFSENEFQISGRPIISNGAWSIQDIDGLVDQLSITGSIGGQNGDLARLVGALDVRGSLQLGPQRASVNGFVQLEEEIFNADLHLGEMQLGTLHLQDAALQATGTRANVTGDVFLQGSLWLANSAQQFDFKSPVTFDTAARKVQLSPHGVLAGSPLSTLEPIELIRSDTSQGARGKIKWADGEIEIDADQSGETLTSSLRASELPLPVIGTLFGRPGLRGTMGLDASLAGQANDLIGDAILTVQNLSSGPPETPSANIEIVSRIENNNLALTGKALDAENQLSLDLTGRIPLFASATPFTLSPRLDQPTTLSLKGGGPVESLWSLFGLPDSRFEGLFSVDADMSGPLKDLKPTGHFSLSEADYEDGQIGFHLKDLNLQAALSTDAIRVTEMSAKGAKGGKMVGAGRYAFDGAAEVSIDVDKLNALQRDDLSAIVSGKLSVQREDSKTKVDGLLEIDRANVDISKLPRGGYSTLNVVFPDRLDADDTSNTQDEAISVDIALKSDRRIFIEGNGLESEWGIDAQILGSASSPQLFGDAFIVRGDVDLISRNFRFAESSIAFNGDAQNARLNIRAERAADDLTASIIITGTPLEPKFELTSDPKLPEDEVLSRVLFGRSPGQLSALEAAQLAGGIASLSGDQSFNLMGSLQDSLGVDRLDLGISDTGEASIGAGKYIAEDIYIEVRTTARGAPGVNVEWTPEDNVEIGTEIDPEAAPRFTIKWKRDYDTLDKNNSEETPAE